MNRPLPYPHGELLEITPPVPKYFFLGPKGTNYGKALFIIYNVIGKYSRAHKVGRNSGNPGP